MLLFYCYKIVTIFNHEPNETEHKTVVTLFSQVIYTEFVSRKPIPRNNYFIVLHLTP